MSSAPEFAALLHELVQLKAALGQHQAALLQLQTDIGRLQRLLIERVLGASAEGPPHEQSHHMLLALAYLVAVQVHLGPLETAGSAGQPTATPTRALRSLTGRQREVAILIAQGLTNRQIAAQLVIAERTADTHVQNLLARLGCDSRSQVAALVTSGTEAQPRSASRNGKIRLNLRTTGNCALSVPQVGSSQQD